MSGSGKVKLTGQLGDVMKESAEIAISYIRENASRLGIDPDFHSKNDIHIHVPEGAVPKDGPSAGVTLATALISVLSSRPVRRDIAMTGEITLRGNVLPIGGLKEKTIAGYTAGVSCILIPKKNVKDLDEIDPIVRENVNFVACETIDDVLNVAFSSTDGEVVTAFINKFTTHSV
jgi:ATP-dependent Lon protease